MFSHALSEDEKARMREKLGLKVKCKTTEGRTIYMNMMYEYDVASDGIAIVRTLYQREPFNPIITCELLWPTPSVNDRNRDVHASRLRPLDLVRLGRLCSDLVELIQRYTREMSGETP